MLAAPHPWFPCARDQGLSGTILVPCLAQGCLGTGPIPLTPLCAPLPQTSNTLSWALYHLSRDPGIQETLYQELKAVVPTDRFPGAEDIPKMPMLRAVIKETLRYSPALPLPQGPCQRPLPQGSPFSPPHWGMHQLGWLVMGDTEAQARQGAELDFSPSGLHPSTSSLGRGTELLSSGRYSPLSCLWLSPSGVPRWVLLPLKLFPISQGLPRGAHQRQSLL